MQLGEWCLEECIICISIAAACSDEDEKWHIYKHDVYGEHFCTCWQNTGDAEPNLNDFEIIEQEDDAAEMEEWREIVKNSF